ncbi:hypothetical protein GCM10023080_017310 [Streptomyces pseudoechinosporeus]
MGVRGAAARADRLSRTARPVCAGPEIQDRSLRRYSTCRRASVPPGITVTPVPGSVGRDHRTGHTLQEGAYVKALRCASTPDV